MDFDMFFSSPRWRILDILARRPSSPLEISQEIGTSVSYVSQQLRLLEAANLIVKERTGNADKGKPRMVFSLPREMLHLTVLINQLPAKKLIYLTNYHKLVLRIWLLENPELHYYVEKLYWRVEDHIENVGGIFVKTSGLRPKIYVLSNNAKVKSSVASFEKSVGGQVECSMVSEAQFKKVAKEDIHPIYDPKMMFLEEEKE